MNEVADRVTISISGQEREILMSFGLLNALTKIVEDPTRVGMVSLDPETREKVLVTVLAERKPSGKIIKEVEDFDDLDISVADIELLLTWVMEHVMGFFIRSVAQVGQVTKRHEAVMKDLESFLGGLENSPSATASSGPSA